MLRSLSLVMLGLAGLLFAGCPSATNLTSARTLDQGGLQVTVAPTVLTSLNPNDHNDPNGDFTIGVPSVEGQLRYGISDRFEIGAKLSMGGFAGHLKVGIIRSESADDGFNVSFDPGVSYSGYSAGGGRIDVVYVYLPLLVGWRFSGHEFTIGPRVVPGFVNATGGSSSAGAVAWLGGGSIAFSFRIGEAFRLTPELSILTALDQSNNSNPGLSGTANLSLGFSFGRN